jgi:hypothetical protein
VTRGEAEARAEEAWRAYCLEASWSGMVKAWRQWFEAEAALEALDETEEAK